MTFNFDFTYGAFRKSTAIYLIQRLDKGDCNTDFKFEARKRKNSNESLFEIFYSVPKVSVSKNIVDPISTGITTNDYISQSISSKAFIHPKNLKQSRGFKNFAITINKLSEFQKMPKL